MPDFDGRYLHVIRLFIEATAPLMIASGEGDISYDVLLVRDVNGLPVLPATSLAGALRSALAMERAELQALFGDEHGADEHDPGVLAVSDGLALSSLMQTVDGLPLSERHREALDDPIFDMLRKTQPILRDHVRINAHGAVDGDGKFTRAAVPRGTRFVCTLEFWAQSECVPLKTRLVDALKSAQFAFGGATRSGYGHADIHAIHTRVFDMRSSQERVAASDTQPLSAPLGGALEGGSTRGNKAEYVLEIEAEDVFRFGQGAEDDVFDADLRPVRQSVIDWTGNTGEIRENALFIPASAIKGPLRHRTAYHLRCAKRIYGAPPRGDGGDFEADEVDRIIDAHFGAAKDDKNGIAGKLVFSDFGLDLPESGMRTIARTSIDRFSGGVRRKALFTEQVIQNAPPVKVQIRTLDKLDPEFEAAFEKALDDLECGWLPLGAGGSKGLGAFRKAKGAPHG